MRCSVSMRWPDGSSSTRKTVRGGALAIVAAIVGRHQGRVRHVPTPGGGATFRVELPAAAPTQSDETDEMDETDEAD